MDNKTKNYLNQEEILLDEYVKSMDKKNIEVPVELEDCIAQRLNILNPRKHIWRKVVSICAACCILFVSGVRFSTVFAGYATNIPGMKGIVEFIRGDSGLDNAREHRYSGVSEYFIEENGYTLGISEVFFDEDRLRFFAYVAGEKMDALIPDRTDDLKPEKKDVYSLDSSESRDIIHIRFKFNDFANDGYRASIDRNDKDMFVFDVEKIFKLGEAMEFIDSRPQYINLDVMVQKGSEVLYTFDAVKLPFNPSEFLQSRVYVQNSILSFDSGEISINEIVISPTRMKMYVDFNMKEGYTFTRFENPYLKDDDGNIYKGEGLTRTYSDPSGSERILFFVPSIYFDEIPEKLYFCFDGIRIASKEGREITLNLKDQYPRILEYMEHEIVIESIEWRQNNLIIKSKQPSVSIFTTQGFELTDTKPSSVGYGSYEEEDENGILVRYVENLIEVEKMDSYNLKFSYPGYFISAETICELDLK